MPKCPNCGLETMRTEDWACRWCGYPLPSGPFRKIDKTYRQLKEERLHGTEEDEIEEVQPAEPEPETELKQDMERVRAIKLEVSPEEETEKEVVAEVEAENELEQAVGEAAEQTEGPAKEPEEEKEVVQEAEAEAEQEVEVIQEPEPEPESPDMELSVEELLAEYEKDDVAADEKFTNKILRVNGVVSMIDIKDMLDTHYIRLTDGSKNCLQSLQCMFDKKHAPALRELEKGQKVTVQGRYNGSVIAMRIVDCVLI